MIREINFRLQDTLKNVNSRQKLFENQIEVSLLRVALHN